MIKAIIFDMGGVLFDESYIQNYDTIAKSFNIDPKKFNEVRHKYLKLATLGKLNSYQFVEKIAKNLEINTNNLLNKWSEIYRKKKFNDEVISLVKKLKKNEYKVIVLSNTNELHAKINYKRGLYSMFDHIFLSSELKIAKPDKKIYKHVLKKLKLKPEECIFIDDKKDNINAAKELGINGIVFIDYKNLLKDLRNFDIKIKP